MNKKNILSFLAIIIIVLGVTQASVILFENLLSSPTAHASSGSLGLCINSPPDLSYDCNTTALEDSSYSCQITASDYDGDNILFSVKNLTGSINTTISSNGTLQFTPLQKDVGDNNVLITAYDTSVCQNNKSLLAQVITVLNVNDPPVYSSPIPTMEWSVDASLRGIFLDDYFTDEDGDPLHFSVALSSNKASIVVLPSSELFVSATNCFDTNELAIFTAYDPYNASADSTPIELSVPCEDEATSNGGGGAGSVSSCVPKWQCGNWRACLENSTQNRKCVDINGCDPKDYIKFVWRNCVYISECNNGVQDYLEDGVDCGGPCPACETCDDGILNNEEEEIDCGGPNCAPCQNCFDGIQNYGETGVDCGGLCPACPTCFDGIQNQNETGIDCGGPNCPVCTEIETPAPIDSENNSQLLHFLIPILLSLVGLLIIYQIFKRYIHKFFAKLIWYISRKHQKQILLTHEQKKYLLDDIQHLEKRKLLLTYSSSNLEEYQESLVEIIHKYFNYILGEVYGLEDIKLQLKNISTTSLVKRIILKHYSQVILLEHQKKSSVLELQIHMELLRMHIFSFSETIKDENTRIIHPLDVVNTPLNLYFQQQLYNLSLALELGELFVAKDIYFKILPVYDSLTPKEQENYFDIFKLIFDDITYLSSFLKTK